MELAVALLVALGIDRWLGEPRESLHPVVWMGNYLVCVGAWVQRHTQQATSKDPDYKSFWLAAIAWCAGAALVLIGAWRLEYAVLWVCDGLLFNVGGGIVPAWDSPLMHSLLAGLLLGLLLKPLLAWALLRSSVQEVESALDVSLDAGRERLRWLVSRDVNQLSEAQVRESAIETLAENLNDSVIAPLFWFVLLGLPGAAFYRFANTADAMWGYRGVSQGHNWEWAGKWAARSDDVLSWIPARLTALLLWAASVMTPGRGPVAWGRLPAQARRTTSPNSGWPMAAMALALRVCLHKPGVYALNEGARAPVAADTALAVHLASKALLALIYLALATIVLIVILAKQGGAP